MTDTSVLVSVIIFWNAHFASFFHQNASWAIFIAFCTHPRKPMWRHLLVKMQFLYALASVLFLCTCSLLFYTTWTWYRFRESRAALKSRSTAPSISLPLNVCMRQKAPAKKIIIKLPCEENERAINMPSLFDTDFIYVLNEYKYSLTSFLLFFGGVDNVFQDQINYYFWGREMHKINITKITFIHSTSSFAKRKFDLTHHFRHGKFSKYQKSIRNTDAVPGIIINRSWRWFF